MAKFKVGDTIFYQYLWFGSELVHEAIILEIRENIKDHIVYLVKDLHIGGKCDCPEEVTFSTKEACLAASRKERQKQIEEYKSQIQTVEDLISFLFEHPVIGFGTDYEARKAAAEMTEELCGIKIED